MVESVSDICFFDFSPVIRLLIAIFGKDIKIVVWFRGPR